MISKIKRSILGTRVYYNILTGETKSVPWYTHWLREIKHIIRGVRWQRF